MYVCIVFLMHAKTKGAKFRQQQLCCVIALLNILMHLGDVSWQQFKWPRI
jgi:hypothetical protein